MKMKALVKSKPEPGIWLEDVPVPEIGINDVLIKIIKDLTGRDYAEFFDDYVRDTKYPDEIFHAGGPELFE